MKGNICVTTSQCDDLKTCYFKVAELHSIALKFALHSVRIVGSHDVTATFFLIIFFAVGTCCL